MRLRKSRCIRRSTVLVVENTKMRFFVGDFFGEGVDLSSWSLAFWTILMHATVSAQDLWKYRGVWLSIVGNFFCPQLTDSCSSCRTRGSITCITRIRICLFAPADAFCILSNSFTRNEIMSIGAFTDSYMNQMIYSDCRRMWFGNCWNPIGR